MAETTTPKKKFAVLTWGCQMNVDDSDQIAGLMEGEGMEATDDLAPPTSSCSTPAPSGRSPRTRSSPSWASWPS
jgi:hypothetical protein